MPASSPPAAAWAAIALALATAASAQESGSVPRAVAMARATAIPACNLFVDAAAAPGGAGTIEAPFATIGAAVAASAPGAIICVAEGVYAEELRPGATALTLAGGFRSGSGFTVRDSSLHVSRAVGNGGSFLRIDDPAPAEDELTAIDGFDISGYAQAIVRNFYLPQRFEITNNTIHDNHCGDAGLAGAGFALANVSGTLAGNVVARNSCGRGGAGFVGNMPGNSLAIAFNRIEANSGVEPGSAHGGALYLFGGAMSVTANDFLGNEVTAWGGGLYVGAYTDGGQFTEAALAWNVYRGNRAGSAGGGFFCDDGATCISTHEIYDGNCGGNIYLDSGTASGPTVARFDHLTNVGALAVGCDAPGPGIVIDKGAAALDAYTFTNAIFWGNEPGADFATGCISDCVAVTATVSYSMVDTIYRNGGVAVTFGEGIRSPADPLFADPGAGDFHLRSAGGRWTRTGRVADADTSPVLAAGDPAAPARDDQERADLRPELGAYGNSPEASLLP